MCRRIRLLLVLVPLPPVLAGRSDLIRESVARFNVGNCTEDLCLMLTGPRGVGKTVVALSIAGHARDHGWSLVYVTARPGVDTGPESIAGLVVDGHATLATYRCGRPSLDLLDHVERRWKDAGVIVVVDELHNVSSTGMGPVSAAVQELSGAEKRKLAFIGVGLPGWFTP